MEDDYVKLAVFKTMKLAFEARRLLHEHGVDAVNVWPVHTSAYGYIDDSHVVTVAGSRVSQARRLLIESGFLSDSEVPEDA